MDIITANPSIPLSESGGVVLEVNAPPNYYYHYNRNDAAYPVARHVLQRLLADELTEEIQLPKGRIRYAGAGT